MITNLYPDHKQPGFGTFVAAHAEALRRAGANVDVAAIRAIPVHDELVRKYALLLRTAVAQVARALIHGVRPEIVEAHIAYPTGVIAWPIARLIGAKLVLYVHGADIHEVGMRSRAHHRLARFIFARADLIVVNSRYSRQSLLHGYGVDQRRVVVLSPGIDIRRFGATTREVSRDLRRVLFVGSLNDQKGLSVLLRAMSQLEKTASLRVIGDGPARASLEADAAALGLEVRFDGAVPPDTVGRAMAESGVLAVPSTYGEALGLVALEGMASGALVIASRTGGLAESVEDGVNGFLVPPGDADALARCIRHAIDLLVSGGEAIDILMTAAQKRAADHDIDAVTRDVLAEYSNLAGTAPLGTAHRQ